MAEVKGTYIINKTVRKKTFNIPNIKKQIETRQLTFIRKVACNSDDHIPTTLLTDWCNYKRRHKCVLYTNKKSIVYNLRLIIPGLDETGALKTWAHFDLYEKYWRNLISCLGNSSILTPPVPLSLH